MRPTNSSGSPSFLPPYHLIALFSKEQRFFCCSQFQYLLLHLFKPLQTSLAAINEFVWSVQLFFTLELILQSTLL